jgi:hypothetical protein
VGCQRVPNFREVVLGLYEKQDLRDMMMDEWGYMPLIVKPHDFSVNFMT